MSKAVVEDQEQLKVFLAAQPLCKWATKKNQEIAAGLHGERGRVAGAQASAKNDNADLAEALSSMA